MHISFRPAAVELRPLFWPLAPDWLIGYLPAVPRVLKLLSSRKLLPTMRVVRQPSSSQLRRLIREADIVQVAGAAILPIISASLAGKPVVVEHHGFPTICPTGQLFQEPQSGPCPGHFIRTGDSANLAVEIERILDDPALSKRFATAHRRVIAVFREEGMIEGHARIYERLLPVRPA